MNCPNCGTPINEGETVCSNCGTAVTAAPATETAPAVETPVVDAPAPVEAPAVETLAPAAPAPVDVPAPEMPAPAAEAPAPEAPMPEVAPAVDPIPDPVMPTPVEAPVDAIPEPVMPAAAPAPEAPVADGTGIMQPAPAPEMPAAPSVEGVAPAAPVTPEAPTADGSAPADAKPAKKSNPVVFIILVIVLIGVIGALVYFVVIKKPTSVPTNNVPQTIDPSVNPDNGEIPIPDEPIDNTMTDGGVATIDHYSITIPKGFASTTDPNTFVNASKKVQVVLHTFDANVDESQWKEVKTNTETQNSITTSFLSKTINQKTYYVFTAATGFEHPLYGIAVNLSDGGFLYAYVFNEGTLTVDSIITDFISPMTTDAVQNVTKFAKTEFVAANIITPTKDMYIKEAANLNTDTTNTTTNETTNETTNTTNTTNTTGGNTNTTSNTTTNSTTN